MRNWTILLIALLLSLQTTIVNSAPSESNNKAAINALVQCQTLLREEKQRWNMIHGNPPPDKVIVTKEGENLIVNVTIDDSVKNIINNQPITRTYTLTPNDCNILSFADIMVSGSYITAVGWRPTLGIGYAPNFAQGFGITANTSLLNINGGIYYRIKQVPHIFIQVLVGATFTGQLTLGLGVGVRI